MKRNLLYLFFIIFILLMHPKVTWAIGDINNQVLEIKTKQDLLDISKNLSGSYILKNDIDLNNEQWEPITGFKGTLDGNGFKIKNLKVVKKNSLTYVGFFADLNSATIKNLTFENVSIEKPTSGSMMYVGVVSGSSLNSTIQNVKVLGYVKISAYSYVGGLVGNANKTTFLDCTIDLGVNLTASIQVGGLIGLSDGCTIQNCIVTGKGTISGSTNTGCLVGNLRNSTVSACYTDETLNSYVPFIGVSANSTLKDCFMVGNSNKVYGLIGGTAINNKIENSYYMGKINGKQALAPTGTEIINSYFLTLTSDDYLQENAPYAKTMEQLQDKATFENWDFESTWVMSETKKYPILKVFKNIIDNRYENEYKPESTEISTVEQLKNISNDLYISYKLTNDIDLNNELWEPILGFTGTFDGNGFKIKNLKVDKRGSGAIGENAGLFGSTTNATIKNLTLENVNITSNSYVGGIVGYANNTTIQNCAVAGQGIVYAVNNNVGGIAGYFNKGLIDSCYVDIDTKSNFVGVGAIVGEMAGSATIKNCFAQNLVISTSNSDNIGSFIGKSSDANNKIENSYFAGKVTKNTQNLSVEKIQITNSYYLAFSENDMKGQNITYARKEEQLKNKSNYTNWDFDNTWEISDVTKYPTLKKFKQLYESKKGTFSNPILISTKEDLNNVSNNTNLSYKLSNDIDLNNELFTPIPIFTGTFDGASNKIKNLKIALSLSETSGDKTGLFGSTKYAFIKNVTLENVDIKARTYVGALIGYGEFTTVENCNVTSGTIYGERSGVAGLIGYNSQSIISKCSSDVTVTSDNTNVGGLLGVMYKGTNIENCYSTSTVNGTGGLVGGSDATSKIENSYFGGTMPNKQLKLDGGSAEVISSYFDSSKATNGNYVQNDQAKTTEQLKDKDTFVGWDFNNVWGFSENGLVPVLKDSNKDPIDPVDPIDPTKPVENLGDAKYEYDKLNRLVKVTYSNGTQVIYTYYSDILGLI